MVVGAGDLTDAEKDGKLLLLQVNEPASQPAHRPAAAGLAAAA